MRKDKGKARPVGGATEQADQEKRRESGNSQFHCNTGGNHGQDGGRISGLLLEGAENAVTAKELAKKMAGLPNVRQLQEEIAQERDAGAVILSTCRNGGGYYLPAEGDTGRREIEEYIRTLKSRALNTIRAIRSARAALSDLDRSRG